MQDPLDKKDLKTVAASLEKAASFVPDPKWNDGPTGWAKIAKDGAAAAKAGDLAATQQTCKTATRRGAASTRSSSACARSRAEHRRERSANGACVCQSAQFAEGWSRAADSAGARPRLFQTRSVASARLSV